MTHEAHTEAAQLLRQAAQLLAGDPLADTIGHLARACHLKARQLRATVVVEVPHVPPQRFTVRQDANTGGMVLTDRQTGEKRSVALMEFINAGNAEIAWKQAGE